MLSRNQSTAIFFRLFAMIQRFLTPIVESTYLVRDLLYLAGRFHQEHRGIIWSCTWTCQTRNTNTIRETLMKPWLLKTVKLLLGEASEPKIRRLSLSNDSIQRPISDMPEDVKDQVINESVSNVFFSSGWVSSCYFMWSVACFHEIYSFRRR